MGYIQLSVKIWQRRLSFCTRSQDSSLRAKATERSSVATEEKEEKYGWSELLNYFYTSLSAAECFTVFLSTKWHFFSLFTRCRERIDERGK